MQASTLGTVLSAGAQTPLGLDLVQTAMLLRAGFASMAEAPLGVDGEPVIGCRTEAIGEALVGAERLILLAKPALTECLAGMETAAGLFVLELDGALPDGEVERVAGMLGSVVRQSAPQARLEVVRRGAGGGAPIVAAALGGREPVIWGGVHSDHDPWFIARLVAADRLYADDNLDAVLPGEAAAFVALAPGERSGGWARLEGLGHAVEEARPDNDLPAAPARGITAALRQATPGAEPAGWMVSDVGFEAWRLLEWQTLMTRAARQLTSPYRLDMPAHRMGSLGAAGLTLGLALAAEGFRRGHAAAPRALVLGGGDEGQRAAALVSQVVG